MLIYRRTSMLESTAQTLTNTVNCVGVMGKGIAHAFKERDPAMFEAYRSLCDRGAFEPGKLWLWKSVDHWVLNFPTKKHWRHPSKLEWIEAGLVKFCAEYQARGIREISFPRLGCGNGNLDWDDVRPLMERYLSDLPIPVFIHDHSVEIGIPEHLMLAASELSPGPEFRSFDGFMDRLTRLLHSAGNELVDLETREPFVAQSVGDGLIAISSDHGGWQLDSEDIRSVWTAAQEGLVTSDQVDRSISVSGAPLVSLVGFLPEFRPVEIQRAQSPKAEVAVELSPAFRATKAAPTAPEQRALQWH